MEVIRNLALVFAVLVILLAAGLTALGGGDNHWEHQSMFRVSNAPERVFAWLTEPDLRKQWVTGLTDVRVDGPLEVGTHFRETLKIGDARIQRDYEVIEFEDGRVVAFRCVEDGVVSELRFEVTTGQSGRQSRVVYSCSAQYEKAWTRVAEPILESMTLGALDDEFEALQRQAGAHY